VYWTDPMVQYVALTRLTYDRGNFLDIVPSRRRATYDNSHGAFSRLFTVPGLILGLFDRAHWLNPPWCCHCSINKAETERNYLLVENSITQSFYDALSSGDISSKTNTGPCLTLSVRNGHKLKDWDFGIPACIQSKSRK